MALDEATFELAATGDGGLKQTQFKVFHQEPFWNVDESGRLARWAAFATSRLNTDGFFFVLLDPSNGCPSAAGHEGAPIFPNADFRFRPSNYWRTSNATRIMDNLLASADLQAGVTLFAVGTLLMADKSPGEPFGGLFDGFTVDKTDSKIHATLHARRVGTAPGHGPSLSWVNSTWTFEFAYSADSSPYPTRISWVHEIDGKQISRAEMVASSVRLSSRETSYRCDDSFVRFRQPRVAARILSEADFPPSDPLPPEYPMREAWEDAVGLHQVDPQLKALYAAHPDARVMALDSVVSDSGGAVNQRGTWWYVTFASPQDGAYWEIQLSRRTLTASGTSVDESHTVWGPHGGPKGLPTDPFAAKNPLISLADTVRLATEAGFTNLNRADWGEPPFSSGTDVPLWTVEYYHPKFSREPDASKTTYIYHAQTGWLVTSEVSIPNSNETYEGKALALKWRD